MNDQHIDEYSKSLLITLELKFQEYKLLTKQESRIQELSQRKNIKNDRDKYVKLLKKLSETRDTINRLENDLDDVSSKLELRGIEVNVMSRNSIHRNNNHEQ